MGLEQIVYAIVYVAAAWVVIAFIVGVIVGYRLWKLDSGGIHGHASNRQRHRGLR